MSINTSVTSHLNPSKDKANRLENYRAVAGNFTFLVDDWHVEQETASTTDTLPNTSILRGNQIFLYSNVSGGTTTLQTSDSQTVYKTTGTPTSFTVYNGETIWVQARPGGGWKQV